MEERYFSEKVVEWYAVNKRDLPWRQTRDPYKIWLSEVILQQTRVSQGLPYYLRFVEKLPDINAFASADEQQILRLWQGLGYYSRARNMHKCARQVMTEFNGVFPSRYEDLIRLPGIGPYTAAAIASIASRQQVAVVDGNVYRVLSRVFGIDDEINSPSGKKIFSELSSKLIPKDRPDDYNQAVMEFGALWCTPRKPACAECILKNGCFAYSNNLQEKLPVKSAAKKPTKRYFYYVVFRKGDSLLMRKRTTKDIWAGLYDFYLIEQPRRISTSRLLGEHALLNESSITDRKSFSVSEEYKHLLSHQTIISKFIVVDAPAKSNIAEADLEYVPLSKIPDLPKPVLISKFLSDYDFL